MFNLVPDIITQYWQGEKNQEDKKSPHDDFQKFCEEEPWAPECKIFDV